MNKFKIFNKILLAVLFVILTGGFINVSRADAAIAYRASSTGTVSGGASISIAMPTGTVQGDVMVASIFANGNQAAVLGVTPPAGWTQVQKVDNQTGSLYPTVTLFTKPAGASEAGPYVFTFSNYFQGAYGGGWIATYTGVNTTTPVDVSGSQNIGNSPATTTSYSTPSITTTAANEMLVFAYAGNCATSGFNTPTSPITASVIGGNINGGCTTGSGYYEERAVAGAGAISTTAITASYGGAAILALKNANTAPTISVQPSASYGGKTRTGPSNTPWTLSFTATDAEQTGAGALTYTLKRSSDNATIGTITGTFTSGAAQNISVAYNATNLAAGSNTLYVTASDGTLSTNSNTFTLLRDDTAPTASTTISTTPSSPTTTSYTVTFTPNDATSTNANEISYKICTANDTCATPITGGTGTSTNAVSKTTGTLTDSTLVSGSNSRWVRTCDGANNCTNTGFTVTYSPTASNVTTSSPTGTNSYYATLNGSANPNGFATTGHFRVFTTSPGNCSADSGGVRYPVLSAYDPSLGSGSTVANFSYTIPFDSSVTFLTPNTTYYYCSYAINANGTTGASSVQSFFTPFGPAHPCDPPVTGSLTLPAGAACSFSGSTADGVDAGSGTTNTANITLNTNVSLTLNPNQKIARGGIALSGGTLTLAAGGGLVRGGLFLHDADSDGVLDDSLKYVGTAPPAGYIRRTAFKSVATNSAHLVYSSNINPIALFDCDGGSNAYTYRNISNLVKDADNDGYKTAAAAAVQCVGASAVFNGRTYYNDGSGPN